MKIKILTTLICLLCIGLLNVNAQKENPKVEKKVVIVKKTVDENGNETVEKIVKEGEDANQYIEDLHIDKDGNKEIKVRIKTKSNGEGENIWISDDNEVINLEGKKFKFHSNNKDENGNYHKKIKIVTKGENGEEEVIEWDGDGEMPEELINQLKEKGIDVKSLDGGKGVFMFKTDGEDLHLDHDFNFEFEGMEDLTPEMKEKIQRIHKEHGSHDGDNDFVFQSSKINTNKAFLGVNIENLEDGGVKVTSVIEGSAAEEAGILTGDIIKSIGTKNANSVDELIDALTPFKPGDEIAVNLVRNGAATQVKAVLKERSEIHSEEEEGNFEVIVIKDCDTNFTGDEDIDILFKTIGDEDGMEDITKEIIVIRSDEDGNTHKEIEVIVEVEVIEETADEEEISEVEPTEPIELAPVVNTDRLKSLSRLKLKDFKAFPNPTDGILNISFRGKKGPMVVQMTDISGRQVYKNTLNDFDG
jgi:hypothetical protein